MEKHVFLWHVTAAPYGLCVILTVGPRGATTPAMCLRYRRTPPPTHGHRWHNNARCARCGTHGAAAGMKTHLPTHDAPGCVAYLRDEHHSAHTVCVFVYRADVAAGVDTPGGGASSLTRYLPHCYFGCSMGAVGRYPVRAYVGSWAVSHTSGAAHCVP